MTNQEIILHLSLIDGIGPATIAQLCARAESISDLYACTAYDITQRYGIAPAYAAKIVSGLADQSLLERELARIEKHAISWTTIIDEDYPYDLRSIYAPPSVIYWRGTLPTKEESTIAFVGSRKANRYGETTISMLVTPLVQQGWWIVSGGALGADSMAHEAALQAKGKTIAILGSGLLQPYPRTNMRLFERIVDAGGALVSNFPLAQGALPGNFPARNRIIAGMSKGCVVIQAAQKSGARITALFALEQGREVFAVPGMIDDELAQGCNTLIQEGAKLVTSVEDIVVEFDPLVTRLSPLILSSEAYRRTAFIQQRTVFEPQVRQEASEPIASPMPDTIEGKIALLCKEGANADELLMETGLSLPGLNEILFNMQLDGLIEQNSAGMFILTRLH
jgi:DNA processing protein